MEITFYKYQGTGNDFIIIDDRGERFNGTLHTIAKLCDRKFGIGADGLILIREKAGYDFEMKYFNADGTQSMCGNGARCAVAFSRFLGIIRETTSFLAIDGPHKATYNSGGHVELEMGPVKNITKDGSDYFVRTGSPHHILFVEDVKSYPVVKKGAEIRFSEKYQPSGSNVNFITPISEDEIYVRTYERGVEDETLSCGTGVTACASVFGKLNGKNQVNILTPGGKLRVNFRAKPDGRFADIHLIGPAEQVFRGVVSI